MGLDQPDESTCNMSNPNTNCLTHSTGYLGHQQLIHHGTNMIFLLKVLQGPCYTMVMYQLRISLTINYHVRIQQELNRDQILSF